VLFRSGKRRGTFVVQGATPTFNPNVDARWLAGEQRRDPRGFAREYECVWSDAVQDGWFGDDVVRRSVDAGRQSSPRLVDAQHVCAIDAAFKRDRFALAVAHAELEDDVPVSYLDRIRTWEAPKGGLVQVDATVRECARIAKSYGCDRILADQYGFAPLAELFRQHGVRLVEIPWTAASKAPRFHGVRDSMADGRVHLVDDDELLRELLAVQGRLTRGGGEQIEARRGHDDRVSAAVLALSEASHRATVVTRHVYDGIRRGRQTNRGREGLVLRRRPGATIIRRPDGSTYLMRGGS